MTAAFGTGRLAGRYELGEEIGRGRSAVFRARDTLLGREVAVKQIELGRSHGPIDVDEARARALREARASARVRSPLVVDVYDVVDEHDAIWLVMELVRAPSLEGVVRDGGPIDERRAARIGLGVLDALEAAHAEGVVHRDVKPANVLVGVAGADDGAADPPGERVKLADFGVAVLSDETGLTSPGTVIGSPSYMAPEQALGRDVGPAADMWALGALLYYAIEGQPPFHGVSALATATAVVHGAPRPQQRPGQLSRVISLLLDKHPEHRPDARRVRAILQTVAGDETVPAGAADPAAVVALRPAPATSGATQDLAPVRAGGQRRSSTPRRLVVTAAAVLMVAGVGLGGLDRGGAADDDDDADTPAPAATADVSAVMQPAAGDAGRPTTAGSGDDRGGGTSGARPAVSVATVAEEPAPPADPAVVPGAVASPAPTTSVPASTSTTTTVPPPPTSDTVPTTVPADPPPDTDDGVVDEDVVDGGALAEVAAGRGG